MEPAPPDAPPDHAERDLDDVVPSRGYEMQPLVGLGGSAGSLAPLRAFFEAMPPDSGLSFVVVQHLAPAFESALPQLLQSCTRMPVRAVQDTARVEPNTVYVIPPGKHLRSADGHLRLADLEPQRGRRVAVDLFFRTLADTHGAHAIGIVLSGADGDGAIGLKRLKERGALTIVQDPDEAEHDSMPRSAMATGMVDWVLPVVDMPRRILDYRERQARLRLPPEEGPASLPPTAPAVEPDEAALREVLTLLRTRTGRDFQGYKRATILRRLARRMQVNGVDDLPSYLSFLRTHQGEAGALLQDLLISVTNFFRDRDAFEALEREIPQIFGNKGPGDAVRVWVPACATGEEAYSLAMLLLEQVRRMDAAPALQVFACDLDEEAIRQARAGQYPDTILADVSEERLRRFFVKNHHG